MFWHTSANRDESAFDRPDAFDISRSPNNHIAFGGGGPHFCLGANLARMEIMVMFDRLLERIPDIRQDGDGAAPAVQLHQRHQAPAGRLRAVGSRRRHSPARPGRLSGLRHGRRRAKSAAKSTAGRSLGGRLGSDVRFHQSVAFLPTAPDRAPGPAERGARLRRHLRVGPCLQPPQPRVALHLLQARGRPSGLGGRDGLARSDVRHFRRWPR